MAVPQYRPQLAALVEEAPRGPGWIHEIKYDGYRIAVRVERGRARLVSRRGNDWTDRFPEIAAAATSLKVTEALVDGEAVVVLPDGRTSFQALQNAFGGGSREGLAYFAFDLLWLDGDDVARRPLGDRRAALARLLRGAPPVLRRAEAFDGEGPDVQREACRLGLEGIVSKRRDQPYRPGRGGGWVKAKCLREQAVVVGGFTEMEGAPDLLGALLAGIGDGDRLAYAGKVGTGWTLAEARALRRRLGAIETRACPFSPRPPGWLGEHARWVEPRWVADVLFSEWTDDGQLRHARFRGLREAPARRRREATAEVGGVAITNPGRVLYPDAGLTKRDVARYYDAVAGWMVPHVRGRPLTLVHCPEGLAGECRYMKHSNVWAPAALRRVRIREKTKLGEYLVADDAAALLALAQMDVLEIHTWNSTTAALEAPDRVVVDLDPGPDVAWREVVGAARLVRSALAALGLESFVKTTGGAGLHVVVPIAPERDWSECLAFARAFAETVVRHDPRRFTIAYARAGRDRKILLDYLRNNRTNTSVAAYSTRARPGAPVSVPLAWDELDARRRPDRFTVETLPRRLRALRADPWAASFGARQRLTGAALRAVGAPAR